MSQTLLISKADFALYADINDNINVSKKLDPIIIKAQFIDLKEVFGQEFYYDLLADAAASPAFSKYSDLMNGSTYDKNGHQYTHEGLKPVLCYFTYSRYVLSKQSTDTAYGQVQKKNEFSEVVSEKTISRLADQARSDAYAYMLPVIKFLDDHIADFPLWKYYNYESFYRCYNRYYPNQNFNHLGFSNYSNNGRLRLKPSTIITAIG